MYNVKWGYANGCGGSASSGMMVADFIIHYTFYIIHCLIGVALIIHYTFYIIH